MEARRITLVSLLVAALGTAGLVSCGGDGTSNSAESVEHEQVSAGKIGVGDALPDPKQPAILSIEGLVSNTNAHDKARVDLATLEKMPLVELEVYEPFEKRTMTFEGVLMSELMSIAGADSGASEVHITALDDYKVDLSMDEIGDSDILLAPKADGSHMSVAEGGPTRIVFPPKSAAGRNPDLWIWSVESMVVR